MLEFSGFFSTVNILLGKGISLKCALDIVNVFIAPGCNGKI